MKRHPALEPFSRDHNDGLILARKLEEDRPGALAMFHAGWEQELRDHFEEEERLFGPTCTKDELHQLQAEHRAIQKAAFADSPEPKELGRLLHDHIRWEERVLFPSLESRMSGTELDALEEQSRLLEARRWPLDPQRERLVRRRWGS